MMLFALFCNKMDPISITAAVLNVAVVVSPLEAAPGKTPGPIVFSSQTTSRSVIPRSVTHGAELRHEAGHAPRLARVQAAAGPAAVSPHKSRRRWNRKLVAGLQAELGGSRTYVTAMAARRGSWFGKRPLVQVLRKTARLVQPAVKATTAGQGLSAVAGLSAVGAPSALKSGRRPEASVGKSTPSMAVQTPIHRLPIAGTFSARVHRSVFMVSPMIMSPMVVPVAIPVAVRVTPVPAARERVGQGGHLARGSIAWTKTKRASLTRTLLTPQASRSRDLAIVVGDHDKLNMGGITHMHSLYNSLYSRGTGNRSHRAVPGTAGVRTTASRMPGPAERSAQSPCMAGTATHFTPTQTPAAPIAWLPFSGTIAPSMPATRVSAADEPELPGFQGTGFRFNLNPV